MSVLTEQDKYWAKQTLFCWDFLVRQDRRGVATDRSIEIAANRLHARDMLTPQEYILSEALERGGA